MQHPGETSRLRLRKSAYSNTLWYVGFLNIVLPQSDRLRLKGGSRRAADIACASVDSLLEDDDASFAEHL